MRCFLGLEIDEPTRKELSGAARTWDNFRLLNPNNYHFTLVFLGDLAPESLPQVKEIALVAAGKYKSFNLTLSTLTTKRDMLWAVAEKVHIELSGLQGDLEKELRIKNIIPNPLHPFRPHVKLAFTDSVGKGQMEPVTISVKSFCLFETNFGNPAETKHNILETFDLQAQ